MSKIGYARCSTLLQELDVQRDALTAAGCERIFEDRGVSGRKAARPGLDACVDFLRRGDVLVVTRLDRLGRSVPHLVGTVEMLRQSGVDFCCTEQAINTTTAAGKMFFVILAAIAEFEADLLRERVNDGLRAARARGRVGGRPYALSAQQVLIAKTMRASREPDGRSTFTMQEIAAELGCSKPTVYRALER
jgi:DNA invertase Pin-like site-specific DNA recombinase